MFVCILHHLSQEWTKLERPTGAPWPAERASHAACCLNFGQDHPQVLVTGGLDKNGNTLNDIWILDIKSGMWREVSSDVHTNVCLLQPQHHLRLQRTVSYSPVKFEHSLDPLFMLCWLLRLITRSHVVYINLQQWCCHIIHECPINFFPLPSSLFLKVHSHGCGTQLLPSVWGHGGHKSPCLGGVRNGRWESQMMNYQS